MKKFLITLLLALAVCAGAVELYWDTGEYETYTSYSAAVLFNDCPSEGPGGTGGREGTIYAFRVLFNKMPDEDSVNLYLYLPEDLIPGRQYIPGEPLHEGELEYEETQEGDWTIYTLVEPFEVPSAFFAIVEKTGGQIQAANPSRDWDHSAFYYNGSWLVSNYDFCIRVEWEPNDTAIVKTSWGEIKATK